MHHAPGLARRLGAWLAPLPALLLACQVAGCAAEPAPITAAAPRRSNVAPPTLTLLPASVTLTAGSSMVFTARPAGGEAMLFSVDWAVDEGPAGGTVSATGKHLSDGGYEARYTAPSTGFGPFHLVARLHEYPSAQAVASITVRPVRSRAAGGRWR
jgi:hypothetical protein